EHAVLAAEAALQFGAREQRGELRLGAGGEQRETIERTAKHAAIDQLGSGITEPAAEREPRLVEAAAKPQAAARVAGRMIGEWLDETGAKSRVDRARSGRRPTPKPGQPGRHVRPAPR